MKRITALILALCLCACLCACKSSEAKKADELILAIGEVSSDSKNAIQDAQSYYDTLTEEQKAEVENYPVLQNASESLERVAAVEESIYMIGTVTADSEPLITAAQEALNALSEEEKALVSEDCRNILANAEISFMNLHWKVGYTVDEFGDKTDVGYVIGTFLGKFSNTATSGSDLKVFVYYFPDSNMFAFRLAEYGDYVATYSKNDLINLSIKIGDEVYGIECMGMAPNGDVYLSSHYAYEDETLRRMNGTAREEVFNAFQTALLENSDEISCSIIIGDAQEIYFSSGVSKYTFKIDGNGFSEQLALLNGAG